MDYSSWLTRAEVAKSLSISGEYVRQLTARGLLPFITTPLGRLYDPQGVEAARRSRVGRMRKRTSSA